MNPPHFGLSPAKGSVLLLLEQLHGHHPYPRRALGRLHSAWQIGQPGSGHAQHAAQRRSIEVRVDGAHGEPSRRESSRQVGRDCALADTALATSDRHDGPNSSEAVGQAVLLVHDLLE